MSAEPISDEAFVEHYRRLCGYIARRFVFRQQRQWQENTGHTEREYELGAERKRSHGPRALRANDYSPPIEKRDDLAAQDLASAALLRLVKCPARYRDQPAYVRRLIVNAIISESKRQQRIMSREYAAPATITGEDWFDLQPGRDGLAEHTRVKVDGARAVEALSSLSQGERLCVEFYYGLNGVQPISEYAIACKLARTIRWVEWRLASALMKLRMQVDTRQGETNAAHRSNAQSQQPEESKIS